jgi:hypothetical protein
METSNMADRIIAEQGTNEPTPAQPVQQVMSQMGAQDEIRGLTPAEVEIIMKMRTEGQAILTALPSPSGLWMIAIPDELAISMLCQVTQKQMEMRWQQEQENSRASARVGMTRLYTGHVATAFS